MTAATADGTAEVAVAPEERHRPALTPGQASNLTRFGKTLEAHFGWPQDVEWAIAGDTVYLLQSRPVTTVAVPAVPGDDHWPPFNQAEPQPYDLWMQVDLGERWPEPVTPLTWSTGYALICDPMLVSFGCLPDSYLKKIEWAKRAYGHVYLNEGAITYALNRSYGMPASSASAALAHPEVIPADRNRYRWGTLLRRIPLLVRMIRSWERNVVLYERELPQLDRWVEEFMARDLTQASAADRWREGEEVWRARLMHYVTYHAQVTSMATSSYGFMENFLEKTMGRKELIQEWLSDLNDIIAAEIVPTLWQIARKLRELGLEAIVQDHEPGAALAQLRQLPEARSVTALFEAFLRRHGHRCMAEAEWLYPRWREAPKQVMETIGGYLRRGLPFIPLETEGQQKRKREEAVAQVETKLNPFRKAYSRFGLKRLHRLIRLRDNGQHFLVKLLLPMRRIYATLGERWAGRGWMAHPADAGRLGTGRVAPRDGRTRR